MPSFARELEQTLHNALGEATKRRHEYATLEHLLIALIDDEHASKVMTACGVNRDDLRAAVKQYLDSELSALSFLPLSLSPLFSSEPSGARVSAAVSPLPTPWLM